MSLKDDQAIDVTREQIAELERQRKLVKDLFAGDHGDAVLTLMMAEFGMFTVHKGDARDVAFREGQRSVVLWILESMSAPESSIRMIEQMTRTRSRIANPFFDPDDNPTE